jgi:DNA-binding transcriptional LysR family regulator
MSASNSRPLPLLELDLLRTFVAIVETGSFAGAAEAVFRTPSAVSMQIKKLEDALGRPVLVRDSRSVTLTRDGEILLEHGRRMLALNREVMAKFITPDIAGVVRLGAPDDVAERFLPDMLRRFADSHPGITINVIVENTNLLIGRVKQNDIDLAVITCNSGFAGDHEAEILYREQLAWATVRGGVAAEQEPLPVSVWEECCVWRQAGLEGLEKVGKPYRIAFQSAYISGQKAAVLADLAVAPLPVSALTDRIVKADQRYGLPELPKYALGLILSPNANNAVQAAADHLRASFAGRLETQEAA